MAPIDLVLADLNAQFKPNIRATARKYDLIENTLKNAGMTKAYLDEIPHPFINNDLLTLKKRL